MFRFSFLPSSLHLSLSAPHPEGLSAPCCLPPSLLCFLSLSLTQFLFPPSSSFPGYVRPSVCRWVSSLLLSQSSPSQSSCLPVLLPLSPPPLSPPTSQSSPSQSSPPQSSPSQSSPSQSSRLTVLPSQSSRLSVLPLAVLPPLRPPLLSPPRQSSRLTVLPFSVLTPSVLPPPSPPASSSSHLPSTSRPVRVGPAQRPGVSLSPFVHYPLLLFPLPKGMSLLGFLVQLL